MITGHQASVVSLLFYCSLAMYFTVTENIMPFYWTGHCANYCL